jgi:hypothetical protein
MTTPIEWASLYARAGWRSFPVKPGAKSPLFKGWQADATTDPGLIAQYWNGPGGAERNLGLVCGEQFDAWDIEVEHVARFSDWLTAHGYVLPECPMAQTGRGGIHLLTAPTGVDGTRYLYLDGVHVGELKSRGGFILACPSETDDLYRWTHLPDGLVVPAAPEWLLGLLERPVAARRHFPTRMATPDDVVAVLGRLAGSVAHAREGFRNSYLYWAVRRAVEEGVPVIHARTVLAVAGREAGLEDREIRLTIESALTAESAPA